MANSKLPRVERSIENKRSRVMKVTSDPASRRLIILLRSGLELSFAPSLVEGLGSGEEADFST